MSDKPLKLTKKQLKATAFRTRKKGKSVLEDPTPFPEADEEETSEPVKADQPKKKRKRDDDAAAAVSEQEEVQAGDGDETLCAAAKRRKRKKAALARKFEENKAAKASKLILFVGNLPFDITIDKLQSFFLEHCDETPEVRLLTPKVSGKGLVSDESSISKPTKGCGFIEFKTSSALQKALRLHQTSISYSKTGNENQKKSRKINIELSAGGGGKSENRLKKIQVSKERLNKQRDKRIEKNLKEITEKRLKYGLEPSEEDDVRVKFGTKNKKSEVVEEDGKADWGSKTNSSTLNTKTTNSKFSSRFKVGKPLTSGANSIKLS